jgi:hypothetical protein
VVVAGSAIGVEPLVQAIAAVAVNKNHLKGKVFFSKHF